MNKFRKFAQQNNLDIYGERNIVDIQDQHPDKITNATLPLGKSINDIDESARIFASIPGYEELAKELWGINDRLTEIYNEFKGNA